jgi:hypothetical protein
MIMKYSDQVAQAVEHFWRTRLKQENSMFKFLSLEINFKAESEKT